jgi:hypothetical protein
MPARTVFTSATRYHDVLYCARSRYLGVVEQVTVKQAEKKGLTPCRRCVRQ